MKFKINNRNWIIKEKTQKEIKEEFEKHDEKPAEDGKYFGITWHDTCEIWLDKNLQRDRKEATLQHELMHCYIANYVSHIEKTYTEEEVCDMRANSNKIINDIVEKYFKVDK